jgi:hypothetical protein
MKPHGIEINDDEWRFYGVPAGEKWACLVWEWCREAIYGPPQQPWFRQSDETRRTFTQRHRLAPWELEDYGVLAEHVIPFAGGESEQEIQARLYRLGCVCFYLGVPRGTKMRARMVERKEETPEERIARLSTAAQSDGRIHATVIQPEMEAGRQPTKAQLRKSFDLWLDANPQWWEGEGTMSAGFGRAGKRKADDGLRCLALVRLARADKKGGGGNIAEFVARDGVASEWLRTNLKAESLRKKIHSEAEWWRTTILRLAMKFLMVAMKI